MLVASQNSKFLVTTLLSPPPSSVLANTSTAILYLYLHTFSRHVPLSAHALTLTQFNSTYTQCSHQGYTPTNVTFNGHSLSRKLMHAYIQHSPTQGTMLCVKRQDPDGSHLVCADGLLWWLRTGYAHTHTDGNPLRVVRRWTRWLLICSDQWFTTWSSDNGEAAPTELAQWLGT